MPNVIEKFALNVIEVYHQYMDRFEIARQEIRRNQPRQQVLLLGQGWFAKGFMENINHDKFSVCNISRTSFVNTPMILSTVQHDCDSASEIDFKTIFSTSASYSSSSSSNNIQHIDRFRRYFDEEHLNENIENINLQQEEVKTDKGRYSFAGEGKYLVCGMGSHMDNGIYWKKTIQQIKALPSFQNKNTSMHDEDSSHAWKKICIIGAGLTGTELAFYLADQDYQITLFDGLPLQKLYDYLSSDGKQYVLNRMQMNKKIDLITNQLFDRSTSSHYEMVIFATGSRPNGLTSQWKLTPRLRLLDHSRVYAGGDGISSNFPRNAQVAYEQGKYVARLLNGEIDEDFTFHSKGVAMYCGDSEYYTEVHVGNGQDKTQLVKDVNPGSIPNLLIYTKDSNTQDGKDGPATVTSQAKSVSPTLSIPADYYLKLLVNIPSDLMTFYYNIFK
jgi:NADH dehydrogenase FAD-containing subunit